MGSAASWPSRERRSRERAREERDPSDSECDGTRGAESRKLAVGMRAGGVAVRR